MSTASPSSATVQREAERERAELASTLDQLRENLRPGNVMDEVMASAKVSTSDISDKVWQTARANPIPAVLIGLGAAMLLGVGAKVTAKGGVARQQDWTGPGRVPPSSRPAGLGGQRQDPERLPMRERVVGQLDAAAVRASASVTKISESAGALRDQAARKASSIATSVRQGRSSVSSEAAMNQYSKSRDRLTESLTNLLDEQPLVLAALGIAVGAAIGAALPTTDVESRYMGEASGSVKQTAQDIAKQEYDHLKAKAGETIGDLKQTAADRGVSSDNLTGLVQDVSGKVRDAAYDVANHAADTASGKLPS